MPSRTWPASRNCSRIRYSTTVSSLGLIYTGRVSGFLYNSGLEANLESDHSGVGYPDNETFRAVCVPPLNGNLFGLLAHEANHVIEQNGLGRPGTAFVSEGLASTVLSETFYPYGKTLLYEWTRSHASQIPPLSSLVDDSKWASFPEEAAYKSSASFLAYLLETSGSERLRQLYYVTSADFAKRFQDIYGRSLADFERDWKEFCARYAFNPTPPASR